MARRHRVVTIGERIRERRLERGLTIRELATVGISTGYISRIETGDREPGLKALRKLAERLHVSPYWLETGTPDPAEELAYVILHRPSRPPSSRALRLARELLSRTAWNSETDALVGQLLREAVRKRPGGGASRNSGRQAQRRAR